jgi:regulator of replication initiation timing
MDKVELGKRVDELAEIMKQLTVSIRQLHSAYAEIVETNKALKDMVASGKYLEDFRAVLDELKKVKTVRQPNVYHEEVVTPKALKERVIKKGLDSPTTLIHSLLHGGVQPIEVLGALSVIREKGRQRWS